MLKILALTLVFVALAAGQASCVDYCTAITTSTACTPGGMWGNPETDCLAWCQNEETNGRLGTDITVAASGFNTIGCRQYHLGVAETLGADNEHCAHASPSGGGVCGTYCENYCTWMSEECPVGFGADAGSFDMDACMQICGGYPVAQPTTPDALAPANPANWGNTVQCRIYHAGFPSQADPTTHCPHASASGAGICGDQCEGYCQMLDQTCTAAVLDGTNNIYWGASDCATECAAMASPDIGTSIGIVGSADTLSCRVYHGSYPSFAAPQTHCVHASFNGGAVCGSFCESYCRVFMDACSAAPEAFQSMEECMLVCANYPAIDPAFDGYASDAGDNVQCRAYHATAARIDAGVHCPHASHTGAGACADAPTDECNAYCNGLDASTNCDLAESFSSVETCLSWCATQDIGANTGVAAATDRSINCRTYHLGVADASSSQADIELHCGHASVTGGNACGSWCDNYCAMQELNCPGNYLNGAAFDNAACMTACALFDTTGNDFASMSETGNDNVQCRLYHGGWASLFQPVVHCPHASANGGGVCGGAPQTTTTTTTTTGAGTTGTTTTTTTGAGTTGAGTTTTTTTTTGAGTTGAGTTGAATTGAATITLSILAILIAAFAF